MPNDIVICLITAGSSLMGAIIGAYSAGKLTNYRLEQLEKKVDALQSTSERLAIIEQKIKSYHE